VLLLHFAFKLSGLAIYLFGGLAGMGYIATFISVMILLSVDFWHTKNLRELFRQL
jgi:hypothetical protein